MAKVEQLHNETHRNIKITKKNDVSDLSTQNVLPIVLGEFASAAMEFPIYFVKNPENEQYQVIALMGIQRGENLFVKDGKWDASYMPARYTHAPFGLLRNSQDENQFGIALDVESELVSETDGEALFNDAGEETEFLKKQKEAMGKYLEQERFTMMFAKELAAKDLLITRTINVSLGEKKMDIDGISMVDEDKLKALSDEDFLDLRKKGMMSSIYTHLFSTRQMNNLLRRKAAALNAQQ